MNVVIYFLVLVSATTIEVRCSKILGVFPSPGYSQFILCEKLMTELARRGHQVTVISPYKPKEEVNNYKTILTDGIIKLTEGNLFSLEDTNAFISDTEFYNMGYLLTEFILSHQEVQKLIHSNETFDLVIVEQFINEAHMGFAQHFNTSLILFCSIGLSEWNSHLVGNVRLPSTEPLSFSQYSNHMTFYERLTNSIYNLFDIIYKEWFAFPRQQALLNEYFPHKMCLKEIMYNASLLLLNSHVTTTHPTFLTASVKEIGGFHISSKKLPINIQQFLDDAENGAIFFSMGSNLKTTHMHNYTLNVILKVFSKMKQRVLWKFDDTDIPNKPNNVLISKWLPQSDILGHPRTVAFISHGGLLSTTEAVYYGVPMVAMPIFGDQKMNVARSVKKGIAVHLPFNQLSEETLYEALNEVIGNPKYRMNSKKISSIMNDHLAPPLDVATYWIEYVIRHGGAPHLKNVSLELQWFQLYLIDVISFVIIFVVFTYFLIRLLLRKIYAKITRVIKQKTN